MSFVRFPLPYAAGSVPLIAGLLYRYLRASETVWQIALINIGAIVHNPRCLYGFPRCFYGFHTHRHTHTHTHPHINRFTRWLHGFPRWWYGPRLLYRFPRWLYVFLGGNTKSCGNMVSMMFILVSSMVIWLPRWSHWVSSGIIWVSLGDTLVSLEVIWFRRWFNDCLGGYAGFLGGYMIFFVAILVSAALHWFPGCLYGFFM